MKPLASAITLGVRDMERAKKFYAEGLGWPIVQEAPGFWILLSLNNNTFGLGLQPREALASDAGIKPDGNGFRGTAFSYVVQSEVRVEAVLLEAKRAGGEVVKPAQKAQWGGSFGYFADPDGYLWKVASAAGPQFFATE